MVKQIQSRETQAGLPPMDESWWEAVMAEDEAKSSASRSALSRKLVQAGNGLGCTHPQHANHKRPTPDGCTHPQSPLVDWSKAAEIYERDQLVTLQVTSYNRGGLLVNGDGLQGFVPVSHLVEAPVEGNEPSDVLTRSDELIRDDWLAGYLNKLLCLKIIECDPERGRVVFSERAALAEPGTRNSLLQRLRPGDCVSGIVTNITDFGVFVDLGGVEGLVHVSEISWGRVHHPTDVVAIGQDVQVFVIQVDRERARIALSVKRLYPNPWETAEKRYYPGQVTEATVTSLVPFGAFARLEDGLDGLIHISEIECNGVDTQTANVLQEGQHILVRVLHVDGTHQRLGLSLKISEHET
jgi:small subunit ribosomal protein S1